MVKLYSGCARGRIIDLGHRAESEVGHAPIDGSAPLDVSMMTDRRRIEKSIFMTLSTFN
ncbi:hypothetical protein ACNOYE_38865 [Nannocystaceae bacterium ST9]